MRPPERQERVEKVDRLLKKHEGREMPFGLQLSIDSHIPLEIAHYLGLCDFYIVNMEHNLATASDLRRMAGMLDRTNKPWLVKVNVSDPLLIRDVQDIGAYGVLMPFIDSAEDLQEVMEICRFPNRGICPMARLLGHGAYDIPDTRGRKTNFHFNEIKEYINNDFLFVPMLESADAVENIDEILAVEGVRLVSFGWTDLNAAMRGQGFTDKEIGTAQGVLIRKARAAGKISLQTVPGQMGGTWTGPKAEQELFNRVNLREQMKFFDVDLVYTDDGSVLAWGLGLVGELIHGERKLVG